MTGAAARIVALVPAHDEAPRIGAVVARAARHLPVIVVDDGSTDDTAVVARSAGARVLEQHPNQGKGAALRTGFAEALRSGVDAVVTLDGDGQHDPSEVPRFLAAHVSRAEAGSLTELIVGRRDFSKMPIVRRIANALGTAFLSVSMGRYVPDNQCGYRLVGQRLMAAMLHSTERGFAFEVEMIAICLREGWPIAWLPVRTIYRGERSHIRPLAHLREFLVVAVRAGRIARSARRSAA